jgi:hypothetical protein
MVPLQNSNANGAVMVKAIAQNKAKGMSDYDAYKNIPAEKEADAKENQILNGLIKKFGPFGQPCKDFCKK